MDALGPFLDLYDGRDASLVCREAAKPASCLVRARLRHALACGRVDEWWLYFALRGRAPTELVLALLEAAPASAQCPIYTRPPEPPVWETWYVGGRWRFDAKELPLHAALRAAAPARVVLALLAAFPVAAGTREELPGRDDCWCCRRAGALPLVLALRARADVEVVRALIDLCPAAVHQYSANSVYDINGDLESWWIAQYGSSVRGDIRGLPLHEAVFHHAPFAVVELLVNACPAALREKAVQRTLGDEVNYYVNDLHDAKFWFDEIGTPLNIAEEIAHQHFLGKGPPVDPLVLQLLRARSQALGVPPGSLQEQRRQEAREAEKLRTSLLETLRREWVRLYGGPFPIPFDCEDDGPDTAEDPLDAGCAVPSRAVHRRTQMQRAQRRAERCSPRPGRERPSAQRRSVRGRPARSARRLAALTE